MADESGIKLYPETSPVGIEFLREIQFPADLEGATVLEMFSGGPTESLMEEIMRRGGEYTSLDLDPKGGINHLVMNAYDAPRNLLPGSFDHILMRNACLDGRLLDGPEELAARTQALLKGKNPLGEGLPQLESFKNIEKTVALFTELTQLVRKSPGNGIWLGDLTLANATALGRKMRESLGNGPSPWNIEAYPTGKDTVRFRAATVAKGITWIPPKTIHSDEYALRIAIRE